MHMHMDVCYALYPFPLKYDLVSLGEDSVVK